MVMMTRKVCRSLHRREIDMALVAHAHRKKRLSKQLEQDVQTLSNLTDEELPPADQGLLAAGLPVGIR